MSASLRRFLPHAVLISGLAATAAWMSLLGYGFVALVELLI
jgi:hypothetical protein